MKILTAIAAALVLGSAAQAAEVVYTIDSNHTFPSFEFKHLGISTFRAKFAKTSGKIVLDMEKKQGRANIVVDADSVLTGVPKFDEHLKSADFFDVAKYPTLTFVSDQFKFEGDTLSSVTGDLTIHGVSKPVTFKVTSFECTKHPMTSRPICGADAETTVKRSEFGLGRSVPTNSDEVKVMLEVEAVNQAAAAS